ncbi:MAG: hypothetical protein M3Z24_05260 [Chloroflexota bacterium]|nr:hypothetical protein [Chloroflexota bacterium]
MNEQRPFDGTSSAASNKNYLPLARWLQHILAEPQEQAEQGASLSKREHILSSLSGLSEVPFETNYHPEFYQQLPDFIQALLDHDPSATSHYGSLLYHLVGCRACSTAYRELYSAMNAALHTDEELSTVSPGTRPLSALPASSLVHLCQLFISQAEAVLRQARHDSTDRDAEARSLLQQAMKVGAQIIQSAARSRALKDLVRVATLFDGPSDPGAPAEQEPAELSYTSTFAGAGARRGRKMRKGGTLERVPSIGPEESVIYLQFRQLEGFILQNGTILELQLHNLDESLRGHYLDISIPLGALIEPVRWNGGNPRAIRSAAPVDEHGTLRTPLGQTEMRLNNEEERDLLEVMFSLLEVRSVPLYRLFYFGWNVTVPLFPPLFEAT